YASLGAARTASEGQWRYMLRLTVAPSSSISASICGSSSQDSCKLAIVCIEVIRVRIVGKRRSKVQTQPSEAQSGAETTSIGELDWIRSSSRATVAAR